jgi:hypothetical protein
MPYIDDIDISIMKGNRNRPGFRPSGAISVGAVGYPSGEVVTIPSRRKL